MRKSRYSSAIIAYFVFSTIGWPLALIVGYPVIVSFGLLISFVRPTMPEIVDLYIMIVPPLPVVACLLMYFAAAPQDTRHANTSLCLSLIFLGLGACLTFLYSQIPYEGSGLSGLYILRHFIPAWGVSFFFGLATLTALRGIQLPVSQEKKQKTSAS